MELLIAGGCGEHGRSCFFVKGAHTAFLVDCGIMAGEPGGGLPRLTQDQIRSLKCVFLTHSHADHTGALPWLRQQGYTGPVAASQDTLLQLPFSEEAGLSLEELCPGGEGTYLGIHICWGRSGHCAGSVWYRFSMEQKTILFSGDYTEETKVYACDPIRGQAADLAVLDCAYGWDDSTYEAACKHLLERIESLLEHHSLLALPVPKYGRGLELLRLIKEGGLSAPCYGDAHFLRELGRAATDSFWCRPLPVDIETWVTPYTMDEKEGLIFLSDPQLWSEEARQSMEAVMAHNGRGLMTGTVETGSFSARMMKIGIIELARYPVHLNFIQYTALTEKNQFQRAVPYHTSQIKSEMQIIF